VGAHYGSSTKQLFPDINLLNIEWVHSCFAFIVVYCLLLSLILTPRCPRSNTFGTRQCTLYHVHRPYARTNVRRFSIIVVEISVWECIPMVVRNYSNVYTFKRSLREHLIHDSNELAQAIVRSSCPLSVFVLSPSFLSLSFSLLLFFLISRFFLHFISSG